MLKLADRATVNITAEAVKRIKKLMMEKKERVTE